MWMRKTSITIISGSDWVYLIFKKSSFFLKIYRKIRSFQCLPSHFELYSEIPVHNPRKNQTVAWTLKFFISNYKIVVSQCPIDPWSNTSMRSRNITSMSLNSCFLRSCRRNYVSPWTPKCSSNKKTMKFKFLLETYSIAVNPLRSRKDPPTIIAGIFSYFFSFVFFF